MKNFDNLKLENQLCFPLYVCSKEIIKKYKPFLDELDLTYTQYITMLVLWEKSELTLIELGKFLFLDSGTLTPVLKKLEEKNFLKRSRSKDDERNLVISITEKGKLLKQKAKSIPSKISTCTNLTDQEALTLYKLLYKILLNFK